MQRVRVTVRRSRSFNADATFEVFGNLGSGTIDFVHPMTPRSVALWPDGAPRRGHLLDAHLVLRHLDSVGPDGHLESGHVQSAHLQPAMDVFYDTPAYVFGRFQHGVVMSDGAGNASPPTVAAVTVNSSPTVPQCVTRLGYDGVADQITFSFEPSRFDAISGK